MRLDEMDRRIRDLERGGINTSHDMSRLLKAKLRAGQDASWYRKCTVCDDWKTHPQIVYPIKGTPDEAGPIGAFQVDGYWVETCWAEHQKYDDEALQKLASEILHNPEPIRT